ncbi:MULTISPECIES: ABC transporter [Streptomyces]|uniref:ABC transporter n=1 Tax=Streptomyces TaxID=1883 RepID=UPI00093BCC46|nr:MULTISPECIES: ABC transporter [Streptomyces]MBX9422217.1 ABC transporter [Streptomyces lateritius]OKJ60541.1 ABC transporter [Streptomyces sp. CB02261]
MTALLRYQTGLLLRSQRWLAPFLLYAAFVGVGVDPGEPVLGALGFAAAALLPVTAWSVRICLTQEPPAARSVVAAAAGRDRAHLAALLTGTALPALVGAVAVLAVTALCNRRGITALAATTTGLLATLACALTGAAVGALSSRPFVPAAGWSLAALVLGSLLALVTTGSPAKHAMTALISGSRTATADPPWLACAGAVLLAAAAAALACRATARLE